MNKLFITVEGGEFVGKTSLVVPGLSKIIEELGLIVASSREPGGTEKAEEMRQLIFEKIKKGARPFELAILFNKARKIHIDELINPFFTKHGDKNAVLILDRYLDSTRVYQGLEEGVELDTIRELEREYVGNFVPNITLLLYFPTEVFEHVFLERKNNVLPSRESNLLDDSHVMIHKKRQDYYLTLPQLAQKWGETRIFAQINAAKNPDNVIWQCCEACIPELSRLDQKITKDSILSVFDKLKDDGYFRELVKNS